MGERGSAHRASVIQIFAYAGYKRDEHGRFVFSLFSRVARVDGPVLLLLSSSLTGARVWMKSFGIPDSRPVLFPWPGVLARAVGPWSCLVCRALAFGSRVGASFPAVVDDKEGRAGAKAISP